MRRLSALVIGGALLTLASGAPGEPRASVAAQGVPAFAPPQYLTAVPTTPAYTNTMTAADFTGDGLNDILVTRAHWPTPERYTVQLLVNDGDGHLVEQTSSTFIGQIPETVFPYRVVVGDFNGDKIPDAFLADTGEDIPQPAGWQSQLILSAPGGHVVDGTPNLPQENNYSYFTDAADVHGDGTLDLYVGNTQSRPPEILLNDGTAHFRISPGALPAAIDPPANITAGRFADVNHDGGAPTRLPQVDNFDDPIVGLQLVDLNRDGAPDIATQLLPQNPTVRSAAALLPQQRARRVHAAARG